MQRPEALWRSLRVSISAATAVATLFAAVLAGTADAQKAANEQLTVGICCVDATFSLPYTAQALGYFQQAGVDVTFLNNTGASVSLSLLTAGQDDVMVQGPSNALVPTNQGKQASVIYGAAGGGAITNIAVLASSPYKQITDLAGKTVGVQGATGTAFAIANLASAWVKQKTGQGWTTQTFGDATTMIAALDSGQIAAVMAPSYLSIVPGLQSAQYRLISDAHHVADRNRFIPGWYPEVSIFGLQSNLQAKREAVIRFLMGIAKADEWTHAHSPQDLANLLATTSTFAPVAPSQLLLISQNYDSFLSPYDGYISQHVWNLQNNLFQSANLGFDLSQPQFQYKSMVDMSYLTEALKRDNISLTTSRTAAFNVTKGVVTGKARQQGRFNFSCIGFVAARVELKSGNSWKTVATPMTSPDGSFTASVSAGGAGSIYRVVLPRTQVGGIRTCLTATSRSVVAK
jgi:ABC-type nitrate/sulfonate/bicarbonate transport system substrate-binding protein